MPSIVLLLKEVKVFLKAKKSYICDFYCDVGNTILFKLITYNLIKFLLNLITYTPIYCSFIYWRKFTMENIDK